MFISLDRIPDKAFMRARLTRDIRKAIVNKYSDIEGGLPEVELISPLGFKICITKLELLKNYTLVNNKKIKMLSIRSDKPITVIGNEQKDMYAIYIPTECSVETGDTEQAISGKYIVCDTNSDGSINKSAYYTVSRDIFQKIFIMSGDINAILSKEFNSSDIDEEADTLLQDNSANSLFGENVFQDDIFSNSTIENTLQGNTDNNGPIGNIFNMDIDNNINKPITLNTLINLDNQNSLSGIENKKNNKYRIKSRIVDKDKNIVAFKLQDKETGELIKVSTTFLRTYVIEDGIDNVYLDTIDNETVIRYKQEIIKQ